MDAASTNRNFSVTAGCRGKSCFATKCSSYLRSHPHHSKCDLLSTVIPIFIMSFGTGAAAYKIYQWAEKLKRDAASAKTMRDQGLLATVYVYYLQIFTLVTGFAGFLLPRIFVDLLSAIGRFFQVCRWSTLTFFGRTKTFT